MANFFRISDLPAASTLVGDELVEVSQVSTTIRRIASTISAQASDNSYNDSGAGFVSAGFAIGDRVRVTGFTGNIANNILAGRITALTASKMTIGGTDGDVIVNDAAGESVTIAKWMSRRALLSDIGIGGGGGGGYDIRGGFSSIPTSSQILDTIPIVRDLDFAAAFAGSIGQIAINPTATFVIDVLDDGTVIGTISISTTGVFTFATTSGTAKVVLAGSILEFRAPATADATANRATWTLKGEQ
jgi:hypothetical protein